MNRLEDQAKLIYKFFEENENALLLVLDACNWKVLSSLRDDWAVKVVRSRGSSTCEWLQRTFTKPLKDVTYVSSNPYTYLLKGIRKNFKHVIDLPLLGWNETLNTVHPRTVNLFVKEKLVAGEKKLIVHYMQPHAPFLADTWLNVYTHDFRRDMRELKIYDLARKNPEIRKKFIRAYTKTLAILLKYIDRLIKIVKELEREVKIVVSSDHSEILRGVYNPYNKFRKKIWLWIPWILGIYKFVGHERNSKLKELYEVPWVVL